MATENNSNDNTDNSSNGNAVSIMTICLDNVTIYENSSTKENKYLNLISDNYCYIGGTLGLGSFTPGLSKIEYDKEMYKPSEVILTFKGCFSTEFFEEQGSLSTEIKNYFFNTENFLWIELVGLKEEYDKSANNGDIASTDLVKVAEYHYVQRYEMSYDENGSYYFTLYCYSYDRKLTLSRYCNVFTGRCLATDILTGAINNELKDIGDKINTVIKNNGTTNSTTNSTTNGTNDSFSLTSELVTERLVMLGYKKNEISTDDNNTDDNNTDDNNTDDNKKTTTVYGLRTFDGNKCELKLPYLVQYNESIYDLVARTAHRCGEVLYFDNGKITMGLPENTRKLIFNTGGKATECNNKMCTFSKVVDEEYGSEIEKSIGSYYENNVMGPNKESGTTSKIKDIEYASDEDLHIVTEEDDNRYTSANFALFYDSMASILTSDGNIIVSLFMLGASIAVDILNRQYFIPKHVVKDYNKDFIDNGNSVKLANNLVFSTTDSKNKEYAVDTDYISNLNNKYLRMISDWEDDVEQKIISINFDNKLPNSHLGDALQINNIEGSPVGIIVRMHGVYDTDNSVYRNDVTVAPFVDLGTDKFGGLSKLALPPRSSYVSGNIRSITIKHHISSNPLEAVVTDNNDPLRMGRVRVRYPWQPEDGDQSPWIRVTTPFASGGEEHGGFTMTPSIGEHVMLDYTDGNIERPFVVGSLFFRNQSKDDPHKTHLPLVDDLASDFRFFTTRYKQRMIASGNGHKLIFRDTVDTNLLSAALPMADVFGKFFKVGSYRSEDDYQNPFKWAGTIKGGGVILRDCSGMCVVSLDPEQRNLSINSCFGDVNINAFTGITISAPNGDINIKGKNVNIEAGNNISIQAGKNMGSHWKWLTTGSEGVGTVIGAAVKAFIKDQLGVDTSKFFDLSFVRSVMEIIFKPVEGTLKIGTQRNLIMTAGTGRVTLDSSLLPQDKVFQTNEKNYENVATFSIPFPKSIERKTISEINAKNDKKLSDTFYMEFIKFLKLEIGTIAAYYYSMQADLNTMYSLIDDCRDFLQTQANSHFDYLNATVKRLFSLQHHDDYEITISNMQFNAVAFKPENDTIDIYVKNGVPNNLKKTFNDNEENFRKKYSKLRKIISYFRSNGKYGNFNDLCNELISDNKNIIKFKTADRDEITYKIIFNLDRRLCDVGIHQPYKEMYDFKNDTQIDISFIKNIYNATVKAMIINALLTDAIGSYVAIRATSTEGSRDYMTVSGFETDYNKLKKYVNSKDDKGEYNWPDFISKIMSPMENAPSRLQESLCTTASSIMDQMCGGLYKYESGGVHTIAPDMAKLFNTGGVAGPRYFWSPDALGRILISSDSGHYLQYDANTNTWEQRYNPDVEMLKRFLRSVLQYY